MVHGEHSKTVCRDIITLWLFKEDLKHHTISATNHQQVIWTVVRGDTSGFKVYVTDDAKQPLVLKGEGSEWDIAMKIKRPNTKPGIITDDAVLVMSITPRVR